MNLSLLTAIRGSVHRTQIRTARAIGMREHRLSRLINEWDEPTNEERLALAEALGVEVEDLFPAQAQQGSPRGPVPQVTGDGTPRRQRYHGALRQAIVDSGKTQRVVAGDVDIDESRLSKIIRGEVEATNEEKRRLARVVNRRVESIFPDSDSVTGRRSPDGAGAAA